MPYSAKFLKPRGYVSYAQSRKSSAQRGHGYAYRKLRLQVISEEPYCRLGLPKCTKISNTADYIVPVSRGGQTVRENLRGVCKSCNSSRGNRI
jgi:5-methylcytosine-specific restriction protein A